MRRPMHIDSKLKLSRVAAGILAILVAVQILPPLLGFDSPFFGLATGIESQNNPTACEAVGSNWTNCQDAFSSNDVYASAILNPSVPGGSTPVTVQAGAGADPTINGQRHVYKATGLADNRYFAFYYSGSNLVWEASDDSTGDAWTGSQNAVFSTTQNFEADALAVLYDPSNQKVHVGLSPPGVSTIRFRRGTVGTGGAITWDFSDVTFGLGDPAQGAAALFLGHDESGNPDRVWFFYDFRNRRWQYIRSTVASTGALDNTGNWIAEVDVSCGPTNNNRGPVYFVTRASGDPRGVFYGTMDGTTSLWRAWWTGASASTNWFCNEITTTIGGTNLNRRLSGVSLGTVLHVVYLDASDLLKYRNFDLSTNTSSGEITVDGTNAYQQVALSTDGTKLYAFTRGSSNGDIYRYERNGGSWGSRTLTLDEAATTPAGSLNSDVEMRDNIVSVLYANDAGANDDVRFAKFDLFGVPGSPGKNDTAWRDFGFSFNPSDTIDTVEIGVEWFRTSSEPILNVTVSWDGGSTWATNQTAANKSADDDTVEFLDFTSATAWDIAKLSDANFRVRVGTNASDASLDFVTVRVNYNVAPSISNFRIQEAGSVQNQRDPTACEAVGNNWTNCQDAFSSNDVYAYANETGGGSGAITFQRAGGTGQSSTTTIDIGTAGNDRLVIVYGSIETTGQGQLSDVTVDGKSANFIALAQNNAGAGNHAQTWAIDEAALGSSNGIVTAALVGGTGSWGIHVQVFYGVDSSTAFDSAIDDTSASPDNEVTPGILDIPANGLLAFVASDGSSGTWNDTDWDTSPTEVADDGLSPEIEMTEATDGTGGGSPGGPFSAVMGTAYWISTVSQQNNRQFRAQASVNPFNRASGVIASFSAAGVGPGMNDTAWKDFGFALGADAITTVEAGVEWFRNNTAPILDVTISWDGGSTWATNQRATNKSSDDDTVEFLDFTSATAWTTSKLNDANLRVRVSTNDSGARLDYATVRVSSTPSRAGTQLDVDTEYDYLFNVTDADGWSDIASDGNVFLNLWYDGGGTPSTDQRDPTACAAIGNDWTNCADAFSSNNVYAYANDSGGGEAFTYITPVEVTPGTANAWVDVDVSAHVPSGATGVVLHVVNNAGSDRFYGLRKPLSSDNRVELTYPDTHLWAMVGVNASRIFQANLTDISGMHLWLTGYANSGVTFFTDAVDKSLSTTGAWTDIDISADTGAETAVGAIIEIDGEWTEDFGLRMKGSSDNRVAHGRHTWAIIGVDDNEIFQGNITATSVDFFVVGYVTSGATFFTNAIDKSLTATGSWLDIDVSQDTSGNTANGAFIEVNAPSALDYGLRENGSSENIVNRSAWSNWGNVEVDANETLEGQIADLAVDFYLAGYSHPEITGSLAFDNASSSSGLGTSLTWSHSTSGTGRLLVVGVSRQPSVTTQTIYSTATTTTFQVPAGVTSITVKVWGAGGGGGGADVANGGAGGGAGYAYAVISVTPGETLDIVVGGGGAGGVSTGGGNGGGGGGGGSPVAGGGAGGGSTLAMGGGGGGGGYAAVLRSGTILVIGAGGGGGGGGGNAAAEVGGVGGAGGGATGDSGGQGAALSVATGGTQSGGGTGGTGDTGGDGEDGGLNFGGDGSILTAPPENGGGGGGSGNYGGGGGGGDDDGAGGGGGGSGLGEILVGGSGTTAGNSSDPDYAGSAGQGGAAGAPTDGVGGAGNPGLIVLTYEVPTTTDNVSYNGVSLTQLVNRSEAGNSAQVELWYLVDPPTGTHDIVVNQSSANPIVGGATSWTGVDQMSPFGPTAVASGTTDLATVDVTSTSNEMVVDVVAALDSTSPTVGQGQSQRWNLAVGTIDGGGSSEPGAGTATMNWTLSGASGWAIAGVSLNPSVVSGPSGPGKNDTAWKDFGFALSGSITMVEVGIEWWRNNTAPVLNVTVSWDGGTTWATYQTATNKSADDDTVEWLDFTSATAWTPTKLNDANFRVRVGTNASGARLDYVTVRVGSISGAELTFSQQTTGANYRIVLTYLDTADPTTASLSEWSVTEGRATYNASASGLTAIMSGPTLIGYEFRLALKFGFQVKHAVAPTNSTVGSYNDLDSWNGEVVATDGPHTITLQEASTGEHMEFGVFMYTFVNISADWTVTVLAGQTANTNTVTVYRRSNDDFTLRIWFVTDLVKGGDTISVTNVQILAAGDPTDNITADTAFAGLGEGNAVYILGSATLWFSHSTDTDEDTTTVQFSVTVAFGTPLGTYTAQLTIRIQQQP